MTETDTKYIFYCAHPQDPFNDRTGSDGSLHFCTPDSAITAASVAADREWADCCRAFLAVMHQRKQMPDTPACAEQMLQDLGFVPQTVETTRNHTCTGMLDYMDRYYTDPGSKIHGAVLLCSPQERQSSEKIYVPFVRTESGKWAVKGDSERILSFTARRLYILPEGTEDGSRNPSRNCRRRMPKEQADRPFEETETAVYFQPNPKHSLNDCLPRAVSCLFHVSIDDAVDRIAEAADYTSCIINDPEIFEQLMRKAGFMKFGFDGNFAALCRRLNSRSQDREYSVLALSYGHAAAILPAAGPDGHLHYQIHDSWDSSECWCRSFWIIPGRPKYIHTAAPVSPEKYIGARICPPDLGMAVIREIFEVRDQKYAVAVSEQNNGQICLSMEYVRKYCIPHITDDWLFEDAEDDLPF